MATNGTELDLIHMLRKQIEELERQRDLYKKSNDFYSDKKSWDCGRIAQADLVKGVTMSGGFRRGGKLAREIQKAVDEKDV